MKRSLCGLYFLTKDKNSESAEPICYSDMTLEQMKEVLKNANLRYVFVLNKILISSIGELMILISDLDNEDPSLLEKSVKIKELKELSYALSTTLHKIGDVFDISRNNDEEYLEIKGEKVEEE